MKKIKLFIGILIIGMLTSLGSCTKFGKNITIEGKVLNPVTGKEISGVEIWLLKTSGGIPGGNKNIKTAISDANGNFELDKLSLSADRVRVGNMHGDYYEIAWYENGKRISNGGTVPIKKGKVMHLDFYAVPFGKSEANVNNVNCQGATDTAYFKLKYILSPDLYDYWSPPRVGCYSHSDASPAKRPIGKYVWITKIKHTGEATYHYEYDTVFISQNGVSTFNINY